MPVKSFGVTICFRLKADYNVLIAAVRKADPKAEKLPEADCVERAVQKIVDNFCSLGNREEALDGMLQKNGRMK